jgi:hypothetical protein
LEHARVSSLTYEDAKRALLDPKLTWAVVQCLACMVLGGQAFDGFCLGRNRNASVKALGSTWIPYALPPGTLIQQNQALLELMFHKSPPAEVPQQLFESSHCPDALPSRQGRAQLASTAACDNERSEASGQRGVRTTLPPAEPSSPPAADRLLCSQPGGVSGWSRPLPRTQLRGGRADRLHVQSRMVQINKEAPSAPAIEEAAPCALLLPARTALAACGSGVVVDETDDAVVAVAVD